MAGAKTGGHIYPAIAVGRDLAAQGWTVTLVTSGEPGEDTILNDCGLATETLAVGKLKGMGLATRLRGVARLPGSLLSAWGMLRRLKPDVAVGFGGFTSGPLLMAAALSGIPVAICEENSVPGFTNRVLSRFARRVFTAFDGTEQWLGGKGLRTGTPLRPEILAVRRRTFDAARPHVLVFGGSQGSAFLNRSVPPVLARVASAIPGLEILHQAGRGKAAEPVAAYQESGTAADVREYLFDMAGAYAWADFVIARSGAGTVSEIAAVGLPALFVPFAEAADNHQVANARPLVERGGALLVEERDFDTDRVAGTVMTILRDDDGLDAMSAATATWACRDAKERIVRELVTMVAQ
jgi:UDP-N-acetylglucosamine--N-acetylmuramyl-(pentapeptide) pyrophosphoryl-undecaprenol N-acetylglucosamine transferase